MRWKDIIIESPMDHIERKKISLLRPYQVSGEWAAIASGALYQRYPTYDECIDAINDKRTQVGLPLKAFPAPKPTFELPTPTKTFIMPTAAPAGFPEHLGDGEIASYITNTASDPVDRGTMEEYFDGATADLQLLPIDDIQEGNPDGNVRSAAKEKRYMKRSPLTMPPLVVENGVVMDGNHRLRVARAKGLDRVWCYVVTG